MAVSQRSRARELDLEQKYLLLAAELEGRAEELAEALVDRALREVPMLTERAEMLGQIRDMTVESIRAELQAFRHGALPDRCPPIDMEFARLSAQNVANVGGLVDGYRRGHQVQWEGWFELVEREDLDPADRRALLERGWRFFFDYAGRMSDFVTDEFTRERDRMLRGQEHRRMHLVRELLEGASIDSDALGYELRGRHRGLVAWGPGAAEAVQALASRLGCALLLVGVADEASWAWLGRRDELRAAERDALARFRPPAGAHVALGLEEQGVDGFRRTHRQALAARRAALQTGAAVTPYESVALEALASRSEAHAREFVARELHGLDGEDVRSGRMRETLEAYFAHGHNAAATAAALRVHEQTVANRLRGVEERIGAPVANRRAELETALRLRRYLAQPG